MGSKSLQTRGVQKSRYENLAKIRSNALKEKGLDDEQVATDPKMKHFKAKLQQIDTAIARISFLEEQTRNLQEKKEQRKAEAEAARSAAIAGEPSEGRKKAEGKKAEPVKKSAATGKPQVKAKQPPKKKGK
jgi:hypothetical protein